MSVIATLLPAPRLQRIRAATAGRHEVFPCDDWQSLTRLCESSPVHAMVVDFCATGPARFDELRLLRGRFPRIAVVGYVSSPPARAQDLFDAGRFGIEGLLIADSEDSQAQILAVLSHAETRSVATLLAGSLEGVGGVVRDAVMLSVTRASGRLTPLAIARQLGVSRRGLANNLEREGFPAPQRMITWGRLIVAGQLLESTRTTADAVAAALNFPSGSAFRNTCQRYLNATPSDIRRQGGGDYVVRCLMEQRARATGQSPEPASTPAAPPDSDEVGPPL